MFTTNEKYEQKIIIRFLTKSGKNNKEVREQLQVIHTKHARRSTGVKKWAW